MGSNKRYTDEFKRDVLAMAAEGTRSIARIERDLDLTPGLVYKWRQGYRVQEERLEPSDARPKRANRESGPASISAAISR